MFSITSLIYISRDGCISTENIAHP